jgi:hypothetical protein
MKPFHRDHRRELAIAAELHGDPKCENQNPLLEERRGPGCKSPFWDLTERSGEVFLLDILSHRMAFHEKAGRSQVGSLVFLLDKVFLRPSLP